MIRLFAIAGGADIGTEGVMCCCGLFPLTPLVVGLSLYAVRHNSTWLASVSLYLAALPSALLILLIVGYAPSEDGDVTAEQEQGWNALWLYGMLLAIAAGSLFVTRRHDGRASEVPRTEGPNDPVRA